MVRGALRPSLLAGCTTLTLGAVGLAFSAGSSAQADLCMALYGAGLGLIMTSITLLRQTAAEHTGAELIRLNFAWALGACLCPALAERALRVADPRPMLLGLAAVFAWFGIWVTTQDPARTLHAQTPVPHRWRTLRTVPPSLVAMTMLITGIEAALGGWLATYSRRGGAGLAQVIAAPSCLWAGLLLSRLLWTRWSRRAAAHTILRGSVSLMAAAGILLLARDSGWTVLLAAISLGCGLGPVYPLLLAAVLRFTRTGDIFFLAGIGSACLPWLTGVTAAMQGSLRAGLLVPLAGTFVILTLLWTIPKQAWTAAPTQHARKPSQAA